MFQKGTIVISIDDGNADDFRIYENILSRHKLSATFNVVSGFVGESGRLTTEQLRSIYNDPQMEIAAHGHRHLNDDEDIKKGIEMLDQWLGMGVNEIGFASPGSDLHLDDIREYADHYKSMGLLYIRTCGNSVPSERQLEIQRRLKAEGATAYVIEGVARMHSSFEDMAVNSIAVLHNTQVDELKRLVDIAGEEKVCVVFMFHRTKKTGEKDYDSTWSYDYFQFEEFAEYLVEKRKNGEIDVLTTKQAFLSAQA